jgi:cystathionine beta-lyase/cystathionine gamma-synthase
VTPNDPQQRNRGFATRAIRAASRVPRVEQTPTSVPIYQSVTFAAEDQEELAAVLADRRPGYAYSRIDNPTTTALADAVAELEGAEAGQAFATGMAAVHGALLSVVAAGDRIVSTRAAYGSTRSLQSNVLRRLGVDVDYVDITDHAAVEAALASRPTAVLYSETISNPTIVVADHEALAALAHRYGALYVVDNTFASPYVCRPLEVGADLVIESATKYLAGHSDVLGGLVVGDAARIRKVRTVQIDTGATLSPFAAFLVLRGIATLAVRMQRHAATALALSEWLERQDGVTRVYYPALRSHPQHELARRQLTLGGGMLAVELAGDRAAGEAFIDALSVPELTASLGSVHTMVVHPPSTTHRQLDDAALAETGIAPGLLRISTGLEDVEDLIDDFGRGLDAARAPRLRSTKSLAAVSGS